MKVNHNNWNLKGVLTILSLMHVFLKKESLLRRRVALSFTLVLIGTVIGIILPVFYKFVLDTFAIPQEGLSTYVLAVIAAYCGVIFLNGLMGPLRELLSVSIAEIIVDRLHIKFFSKITSFKTSLDYLLESPGSALNILERSQKAVLSFFCDIIFFVIPSILEICFAILILSFLYPFKYAFILLMISIAYTWVVITSARNSLRYQKHDNNIRDKCANFLINILDNWELIKYTNTARKHNDYYSRLLNNKHKIVERALGFQCASRIAESLVITTGTVITLIAGIIDVHSNKLTVGGLTLVFSYATQFFFPLKFLGLIFFNIQRNLLSLDELSKIITHSNTELSEGHISLAVRDKGGARVEFRNVGFKYDRENNFCLNSINFTAMPGEKIAIIGRNGSGKSTLCKLMLKKYPLVQGDICIDSINLTQITSESISSTISITPQNLTMFPNTLLYNLRYFNTTASLEVIEELCDSLGILGYINTLPERFETRIQSYNNLFSVGQMQLLGVARCIIKDAPIYIFDEPTSALDPISEKAILNTISRYLKNKTIFYITHNIEVGQKFDKILVIEKGSIKELGSYSELMQKQTFYYNLLKIKQGDIN